MLTSRLGKIDTPLVVVVSRQELQYVSPPSWGRLSARLVRRSVVLGMKSTLVLQRTGPHTRQLPPRTDLGLLPFRPLDENTDHHSSRFLDNIPHVCRVNSNCTPDVAT